MRTHTTLTASIIVCAGILAASVAVTVAVASPPTVTPSPTVSVTAAPTAPVTYPTAERLMEVCAWAQVPYYLPSKTRAEAYSQARMNCHVSERRYGIEQLIERYLGE